MVKTRRVIHCPLKRYHGRLALPLVIARRDEIPDVSRLRIAPGIDKETLRVVHFLLRPPRLHSGVKFYRSKQTIFRDQLDLPAHESLLVRNFRHHAKVDAQMLTAPGRDGERELIRLCIGCDGLSKGGQHTDVHWSEVRSQVP